MKNFITETKRCYIREIRESDVAAETELYNSSHMTDFIDPPEEYDKEVLLFREYADKVYKKYGYGMWGIFDKASGQLIGEAGLEPCFDVDRARYPYNWMFERNCAELGFFIAEHLWGKGYCTEACTEILTYCREHFGITRVFARAEDSNTASVRVLSKLGFSKLEENIYFLIL